MSETWYRLGHKYEGMVISPVEVVSSTKKSVVYMYRHYNGSDTEVRTFDRADFFRSFEEAKTELVKRAETRVQDLQSLIVRAQQGLEKAKAVTIGD